MTAHNDTCMDSLPEHAKPQHEGVEVVPLPVRKVRASTMCSSKIRCQGHEHRRGLFQQGSRNAGSHPRLHCNLRWVLMSWLNVGPKRLKGSLEQHHRSDGRISRRSDFVKTSRVKGQFRGPCSSTGIGRAFVPLVQVWLVDFPHFGLSNLTIG